MTWRMRLSARLGREVSVIISTHWDCKTFVVISLFVLIWYYEQKSLNHGRLECLRSESKCTPSSTFLPICLINSLTVFTRCIDWRSKCQIHSSLSVGWTGWHCVDQAERGGCTGAGKDCAGERDLNHLHRWGLYHLLLCPYRSQELHHPLIHYIWPFVGIRRALEPKSTTKGCQLWSRGDISLTINL